MTEKTEYSLLLEKNNNGTYSAYETHCGTSVGCFYTEPAYVGEVNADEIDKFINEFKAQCEEFGDELTDVGVKI